MKLIIAGSRDIINKKLVFEIIEFTITHQGLVPEVVICGCAKGVDTLGAEWAHSKGIPIKYVPAHWASGKKAGHMRNAEMARGADTLLVIRKETSPGSANMVKTAQTLGLDIHDIIIPKSQWALYESNV